MILCENDCQWKLFIHSIKLTSTFDNPCGKYPVEDSVREKKNKVNKVNK